MRRRQFIAGTAATALNCASRAHAQPSARSPVTKRIAIFFPSEFPEGRGFKAYFDELNKLGFVEGRNLIVERHTALSQSIDRYGNFARQIVASHPDVTMPVAARMVREINALGTGLPVLQGDQIRAGAQSESSNVALAGISADIVDDR